ncbi:uncharacterized protein C8R40DRAFT_995220, partial [Lentinula edodes]|uniref:uncharacterized protein n=1 Tax=Lentinula edodes TaxID=5353 RepID=UPI001E8D6D8E
KLQRRLRIASMMLANCKSSGNEDGVFFWSYILRSLDSLASTDMSDEETVCDKEDHSHFRIVMDPVSRHPAFRILFRYVDDAPSLYPDLFKQCGKKPLKRV